MAQERTPAYQNNLMALTIATMDGKIYWKQQNPTTYFYESKIDNGQVFITSIQRLGMINGQGFVFQIIDSETKEIVINIDTSFKGIHFTMQRDDYKGELDVLYTEVVTSVTSRSNKIFQSIIDNINK